MSMFDSRTQLVIDESMDNDRIAIDPNGVNGGMPYFRGTDISVAAVTALLAIGITKRHVLRLYPELRPDGVAQALEFATEVLSGGMSPGVVRARAALHRKPQAADAPDETNDVLIDMYICNGVEGFIEGDDEGNRRRLREHLAGAPPLGPVRYP